jgi:prepilin-type processing-associated H-X9-DG protein
MRNMKELALALQLCLVEHEDTFPPVNNVYDPIPLLDQYVSGRHVFMRPGTEDETVVDHLVPAGSNWREIEDLSGTPIAVSDYHPDFAIIAYADGHVEAADKTAPAFEDRWWEGWWQEFERESR